MDVKFRGAVNFLPEMSNRAGEQAEKLPKFPIVLSEKFPSETDFCPTCGGSCSPSSSPPQTIMLRTYIESRKTGLKSVKYQGNAGKNDLADTLFLSILTSNPVYTVPVHLILRDRCCGSTAFTLFRCRSCTR